LASDGGSVSSYDLMGDGYGNRGFWITGDHNRALSEIQYAVDSYFRSEECFKDECDRMFHGSTRSCYLEHGPMPWKVSGAHHPKYDFATTMIQNEIIKLRSVISDFNIVI